MGYMVEPMDNAHKHNSSPARGVIQADDRTGPDHRTVHAQSANGGHDHDHGHGDHGGHVAEFRRLFWIMLVLAVPVVVLNEMFASLVGYRLPAWDWIWWVSP